MKKILYITEIATQKLQIWRNLRELRKRYSGSVEYGDSSVAKRKTGRLSISLFPNVQEETVTTRSMSSFFDKALYIIFQCPGGVIDRVQFKAART